MKKLTSLFLLFVMLGNTMLFNIQMVYAQDEAGETTTVQAEVQSDSSTAEQPASDLLPAGDAGVTIDPPADAEDVDGVEKDVEDAGDLKDSRAKMSTSSVEDPEPAVPILTNTTPTDPLAFLKGLSGDFSTDLFTGGASFGYGFWLPQGRGAAQPALSLRYSSHNRNFSSFVGYGWSLPTNGIFRSTPKGVDKLYSESVFSADIFGNTEELISTNSGQGLYSPKIEGSFVEYKYDNNSWVAIDTHGTKYFFGSSSDTRQTDPDDSSKVYKWLLEKVEDVNGNYLTMTYFHDQGQVYPETIRYSGHGVDMGIYEIVFNWGQRSSAVTSYTTSFKVITDYHLVSIDIVSHHDSTPQTARSYFFEYNTTGKVVETLKSVIVSDGGVSLPPLSFEYFDNSGVGKKIHFLKKITNIHGGTTELSYKPSTSYRTQDSKLANSHLPFNINTIHTITTTDPTSGVSAVSTYDYSGGHYYYDFADAFKKEYAGFAQVVITDTQGNVAKHFFHQSEFSHDNADSVVIGEYEDHICKKGRIYRTETSDDSENLFTVSIKKWDKKQFADDDSGKDRFFPYLSRQTDLQYDGTATAKTISSEYVYDDFGKLVSKTGYGEVTATNDAGDFTDIGNDKITISYQYAQNISNHILFLPSLVESRDFADAVIARSKNYYDDLDLGSVDIGNLTKQEKYFDDTHFITSLRSYNSYGLVEDETDPRGNTTSYDYDQFNLFPESVTNAKNQTMSYVYDYLAGKVTQTIDPNGQIFQTGYDGFGRKTEQRQPDVNDPAVLVVASSYVYNDTSLPASITQTNYLDDVNGVEQRTYLDGFDRAVQTKTETETADIYTTKDIVYNDLGQVEKESLPYFSTGFAKTSKTTNDNLYTGYIYDALGRIISSTNAVGATLNSYDDWKVTTADAKNNIKTLESDAYGNLVKVEEYNGDEIYTTRYEYDLLGNLKKIIDAKNNERNFVYDFLGRIKTSEDLHATTDTTFGIISYDYDDAGNLTQKIDAKGDMTIYGYDELNRIETEDNTSQDGVEASYVYDVCANGVGRLCSEANSDESTDYVYNVLGLVEIKTKNIDAESEQESYEYDWQGNVVLTVYPDNSQVKNEYNSAGQIEKTLRKEDGDDDFTYVITKTDYNPLGQIKYQENANGTATTNTYDENELYRLKNKKTEIVGGSVAMSSGEGFSLAEVSSGVFKIPPTPLCERGENLKDCGGVFNHENIKTQKHENNETTLAIGGFSSARDYSKVFNISPTPTPALPAGEGVSHSPSLEGVRGRVGDSLSSNSNTASIFNPINTFLSSSSTNSYQPTFLADSSVDYVSANIDSDVEWNEGAHNNTEANGGDLVLKKNEDDGLIDSQSFEGSLGRWLNTGLTNCQWRPDADGTPSGGTGPSNAVDGKYYAYVETSSGYCYDAGSTAIIEQSLPSASAGRIEFYYHMYGANMGTLKVDAFNGTDWFTVWNLTGNQGDVWSDLQSINFPAGTIKLRFDYIAAGNYAGDVAIDLVKIYSESDPVQSSSYLESFENSLGRWVNSTADNCEWFRDRDGTPSGGTGPTAGKDGNYYAYVETSSGYCYEAGKTADLEYQMTTTDAGKIEFYYNMYGANIGTLKVDAFNGSGWSTVWSLSGNKGTAWSNLQTANFPAGTIKLRFHYIAAGNYAGDAAIDVVNVTTSAQAVVASKSMSSSIRSLGTMTSMSMAPSILDSESFETSLGNWTNTGLANCQWQRDSNGTPSGNTGPSNAVDGNYYVYVETSAGYCYNAGNTAVIEQTLPSPTAGRIEFYYHMYGANMGALKVDAFNGTDWLTVWNLTGNQGNAWSPLQSINFPAGTIKIRFDYIAAGNYAGDAAIDLVKIYSEPDPVGTDLYSENFENSLGRWVNSTADNCEWFRDRDGTPSGGTGPTAGKDGNYYAYVETSSGYCYEAGKTADLEYQIPAPTAGRIEFYYNMYGANIGTLKVDAFNGSDWITIWNLNGNQGSAWSPLQTASFPANTTKLRFHYTAAGNYAGDAAIDVVNVYSEADPAPSDSYLESFEGSLGRWINSPEDNCEWFRQSGSTPSGGTGPTAAKDGGYYAYVETSSGYCYEAGKTAVLEYPLPQTMAGEIEFYYHMYGANMGALKVDAFDGSDWTTVWNLGGNQGAAWSSLQSANFPPNTSKLRFHYTAAGNYAGDAAIDVVNVIEKGETPDYANGSWISKSLSLDGVTNAVHSKIEWAQMLPANTSVKVYTGLSASATVPPTVWDLAISGDPIQNITGNLSGKYLWSKIELESGNGKDTPRVEWIRYIVDNEPNIAPIAPSVLESEGQINPSDIIDTTPEFTAIFHDPNRNEFAKYYQIQVINEAGDFAAPLWDSGKTALTTQIAKGARSEEISYSGTELALDGQKYYLRIKFWDDENAEGAWSDGADSFTMLEENLAPTAPTSLEVEQETNPLSVQDSTPEFTAIFNDPNSTEFGAYYQIQVITESGDFASPLWDSNKTELTTQTAKGERSEEISFDGTELALDGTKYYWRIKFYDDEGAESVWSDGTDYFAMYREPIRVDVLQDLTYTYDEVGNITKIIDASETDSAKTSDFEYDDLYRLKKVTVTNSANGQNYVRSYDYDAIGNITYKSDVGDYLYEGDQGDSYANPHAVTSAGDKSYVYDENGNLVTDGTWTHSWDYNNRLTESTNGTKTISYGYDVSGNRVVKSDGTKTSYYFSQYYDVEDGKIKKHIYSGGSKVATVDDGNIVYHHTDHLTGSNAETNDDGNMVEVIDYYPFGSTRVNESFGGYENDYKFTGKEKDEDTGLYYYGARYYDGEVGRFVGEDPMVTKLDRNEIYSKLYESQYSKDANFNNLLSLFTSRKGKIKKQDLKEQDLKKASLYYYLSDPQQLNSYSYVTNNPLISIDATGEHEVHVSFSSNVGFGGETGSTWSFGISTDGSYGVSMGYHAGGLIGGDASLGVSVGYSDADSWGDTEGKGGYAGMGTSLIVSGPEVSVSLSEEGTYEGADLGLSMGPSTPLYGHAGKDETAILVDRNIKQDLSDAWNSVKKSVSNFINKIKNYGDE